MANTFYTADEHYGHRNIIKFCNRPFTDIEHMKEELIRRHNSKVGKKDEVYHVGDMFWRTLKRADMIDILENLNGTHYYVLGNHEELIFEHRDIADLHFKVIRTRLHMKPSGGPKAGIVLDHFAGRVWHQSDKGSWQLYGHTHGELPDDYSYLAFDVGVDANDWYPVSLDEVASKMGKRLEWHRRRVLGGMPTT